jgi:hypothetical protein
MDVYNYYSILLEEQAETTRQLIQQTTEGTNRDILFVNVDLIENEPLPDVQLTNDDYIVLIADFYTYKIETLQNIQNIIKETTLL